ncbi:MAG: hypothetical protein WD557_01765 [Dehalococcoidia bacterium]
MNIRRIAALGAGVTVLAGAALSGACGSDDGASQESEVLSAISILDGAGLHGIDESINEENEIPADARTVALHMQALVELTQWPSDVEDAADGLAQAFEDFAAALDGDSPDMARAGELAAKAHDEQHDLSHDVWAWLQEEAGIDVQESGDHEG